MSMAIGIDVDGVTANFVGAVCALLGIPEDGTYDDCSKACGGEDALWARISGVGPAFHRVLLSPVHGAREGVAALMAEPRFDVWFVTSQPRRDQGCDTWVADRTDWLVRTFGIHEDSIVFTRDKSGFHGDVLIDDYPHQLEQFERSQRSARGILFCPPRDGILPARGRFLLMNGWDDLGVALAQGWAA